MKKLKVICYKALSLMIALAIMLNLFACCGVTKAHAASTEADDVIMVVTSDTAKLRAKNSSKGDVIEVFERGDLLRVVDCSKNSSGNYWYTVQYGDITGYMFADHLKEVHECTMVEVAEGFSYCECGRYAVTQKGLKNTNSDVLNAAGSFLTPEMQEGFIGLGVAVSAAKTYLAANAGTILASAAAGGATAILVVGGIYGIIKLTANRSATKVNVEVISIETAVKNFEDLEDDAYYIARSNDKTGTCCLFYWPYPLDAEGACNYLTALAISKGKPTFYYEKNRQQIGLNGIYAKSKKAAEELAKKYDALGPMFDYGRCKSPDHKSEVNKSDQCYEHFHIFYRGVVTGSLKKIDNVHVFFGMPTLHPDYKYM